MANTTNFSVRMDVDIKKQCETLYSELGMNLYFSVSHFVSVAFLLRFDWNSPTKKPSLPCWRQSELRMIQLPSTIRM